VTVETPDGERHTLTIESESVYDAAMSFLARSGAAFPGDRELPAITSETLFEVRPIYKVTQKRLME
jgi:hypothetical protein